MDILKEKTKKRLKRKGNNKMKREIVFEKEELGHAALTDVISGEQYILRSFRGRNEKTGETLFRLDRRGVSYFLKQGGGGGRSIYRIRYHRVWRHRCT